MKRSRLRARSKKRDAEADRRAVVREQVFARDGYRCVVANQLGWGMCFGPLTPHHKRKSSQGGKYTMRNLVTLCAHHNDLIESDAKIAALARDAGLVLRHGDQL